jgi:hypothetical protein
VSGENGPMPAKRRSSRPYRDSALLYGAMALVVIVIGLATDGGVLRSLGIGVAAFVLATGWTWWRMRVRERRRP